ncbi:winged helix-turn-helix transcriptional regulator [Cellulomonas soli]
MRSYDQFCGLAYALDVIGDRWNLLVVRELLLGPRRHRDLVEALPGVASNLLGDRLRALEDAGIVARDAADGRKSVVYSLTPRGEDLRESVLALVRWGSGAMAAGPRPDDTVRPAWVGLALEALLTGRPSPRAGTVALLTGTGAVLVHLDPIGTQVTTGPAACADTADAVLDAPPALLLGLVAGAVPLAVIAARAAVVRDPDTLLPALAGAGAAVRVRA